MNRAFPPPQSRRARRLLPALAAVLAAGAVPAAPLPGAPDGEWELVWADEFEGDGLDRSKWNVEVGGGGFGNNEWQFYTGDPANLGVADGRLVLTAREQARDGHRYTSAKITTEGKGEWTYGRFEVRARLPRGQGIWPAIWMMPPDLDRYGGWPSCGEIDIMEMVGHAPSTVYGTLHYGNPWENVGAGYSLPGERTFADDFHAFRLDWSPGRFDWYVDGTAFHTETDWYTSGEDARWPAPFDRPFFLQLNLAVGGNWPGYPDETTQFPQRMEVDYVRVYRYLGAYPAVEDRSARPAFLEPREPLPDGNLVYNGGFDAGTRHWEIREYEGGSGRLAADGGALRIGVEAPGIQPWSVQVMQRPVAVRQDQAYRLRFRARSDRARTLEVNVGKASQPWTSYSGKQSVELGPGFETYAFTFTMPLPDDLVARVEFNAGAQPGPVWVDAVSLHPVDPGPR